MHKTFLERKEKKGNRILLPGDYEFEEILEKAKNYDFTKGKLREYDERGNITRIPDIMNVATKGLEGFVEVPGIKTPLGRKVAINPNGFVEGYGDTPLQQMRTTAAENGFAICPPFILKQFLKLIKLESDTYPFKRINGTALTQLEVNNIYNDFFTEKDTDERMMWLDNQFEVLDDELVMLTNYRGATFRDMYMTGTKTDVPDSVAFGHTEIEDLTALGLTPQNYLANDVPRGASTFEYTMPAKSKATLLFVDKHNCCLMNNAEMEDVGGKVGILPLVTFEDE